MKFSSFFYLLNFIIKMRFPKNRPLNSIIIVHIQSCVYKRVKREIFFIWIFMMNVSGNLPGPNRTNRPVFWGLHISRYKSQNFETKTYSYSLFLYVTFYNFQSYRLNIAIMKSIENAVISKQFLSKLNIVSVISPKL